MRKLDLVAGLLALTFPLQLLAGTPPAVAVDIAPVHSLVSQVMKGVATPDLIIPAEASPHEYALRPSQAEALAKSDVVFWIGEEFSPWLEKTLTNVATTAKKVELLEVQGITTHAYREGATFEEHGHHDEHDKHHDEHDKHHDEHDKHPEKDDKHADNDHRHHHDGVDPHAWLDPQNAKVWLLEINRILKVIDPANTETYQKNTDEALIAIDQLIRDSQRQLDSMGQLQFVVFHDAYQYFEKRFGKLATGSISLGDAEDPSPARIAEIKETVQRYGVNCAFSEPQYNSGLVNAVFENSSVESIGIMDPLGANIEIGVNHYADLIRGMVTSLSTCPRQ